MAFIVTLIVVYLSRSIPPLPILGPPPKAMSRARLLGKLAGDGDIGGFGKYDDDVMGDVQYSSSGGRRGG